MPRRDIKPPIYGFYKATGRARVVIDGTSHYLGSYGSPESREKCARLISKWEAGGGTSPTITPRTDGDITVVEVIARYWRYVQEYYVKNGHPMDEQESIRRCHVG